jgi:tetratricopeptide (TPR) repeat protein
MDALEELYADRLAEQVERLAHHAWHGEVWEKAVAYLRQAGAKAIAGSANREAVAHFERALVALGHLPEGRDTCEAAIDLRLDLRNALWPLGEFGRIFDCLRDAETIAQAMDDRRRLGQVSGHLTAHFATVGRHDQAIASGQRTLAVAEALGDFALQVRANYRLGVAHNAQGNYARAIEILLQTMASLAGERSRERFGMAGLPAVFCLGELARSLAALGRFAEGIAHAEEAASIAEAVDHPLTLIDAYLGVGGLYLRKGDFHKAIPVLERGRELCQTAEMPAFAPWVTSTLGYAQALSGRVAEALPLLEQAMEQATSMGRMGSHSLRVAWLSEAYLLANQLEKAIPLALHALNLARTHQERGHQAWIYRLLGEIHAHQEPPAVEQAEEIYQQAMALAEELGMRPLQAHCHRGLGMLYGKLGRQEHAHKELSTAIEMYRTMAMTLWLPEAEAALAQGHAR